MNIFIVSRGFPTDKYRMHGIFEFDQAKLLKSMGHNVIMLVVDVRSIFKWRKWGLEMLNIDGIPINSINIPGGRIPWWMLRKMRYFGLKVLLRKAIQKYGNPDILHAHFFELAYAAAKLKPRFQIPLVVTEHSAEINLPIIKKSTFSGAHYAYRSADLLIAVSPSFAKHIEQNFAVDVTYIPNVVDTDLFYYAPSSRCDKIFHFVSAGGLDQNKRMDYTIEAFRDTVARMPKAHLTIFGEGSERRRLEQLIKKNNLEARVKLMGLCTRAQLARQLQISNCFVLASKAETFGVAYAEALATGIPVIATKCGGPEEFVNETNGILIPVDDKTSLSKAMLYMYENIDFYDRQSISLDIEKCFSKHRVAFELTAAYKSILSKQNS